MTRRGPPKGKRKLLLCHALINTPESITCNELAKIIKGKVHQVKSWLTILTRYGYLYTRMVYQHAIYCGIGGKINLYTLKPDITFTMLKEALL